MTNFKRFGVVKEASDHEYILSNMDGRDYKEKVSKKIKQEWSVLEKALPASIFVRVYEDRVDLLRAAIIGPPGTPYFNGIFFFDICFPKDYPACPPTVYYHSFGMEINPNLHSDGLVRLSLLDIWNVRKVKKMNSSKSRILQVLLSLEALVLDGRPYFNECDREFYRGSTSLEKKSLAYNEEIWVKTCKSMITMLEYPLQHFEEFIIEHFYERAQTILLACKAYLSGDAKVGDPTPNETASSSSTSSRYDVSELFWTSMLEVCPRLVDSLASTGALVQCFKSELLLLRKPERPIKKEDVSAASKKFKLFDTVNDASDHNFVNSNHTGDYKGKVSKNIMKEWKILDGNLPDTIFVRGYEDRIDLLRAVIVGPPGTPYYNGLFFFDFCFPSDYPSQPPTVKYRSFGMRLNPNLYEDGYVCLSLLNTWPGGKREEWIPSQSTVLQILLSLQALVLNEKPYFNEPGVENSVGMASSERCSLTYNEETWVNSCKSMILLLRTPPKHFEQFVVQHFYDKSDAILQSCKAYMNGHARVGDQVKNESYSAVPAYEVSDHLSSSMHLLCPQLSKAFATAQTSVEPAKAKSKPLKIAESVSKKTKEITKSWNLSKRLSKFSRDLHFDTGHSTEAYMESLTESDLLQKTVRGTERKEKQSHLRDDEIVKQMLILHKPASTTKSEDQSNKELPSVQKNPVSLPNTAEDQRKGESHVVQKKPVSLPNATEDQRKGDSHVVQKKPVPLPNTAEDRIKGESQLVQKKPIDFLNVENGHDTLFSVLIVIVFVAIVLLYF